MPEDKGAGSKQALRCWFSNDDYYPTWSQSEISPDIAYAEIFGGPLDPEITGMVLFEDVPQGVSVSVEVYGLPPYQPACNGKSPVGPHGFHIHEKGNCQIGDPKNPFMAAGEHYNPTKQPHGNHAGDMPVLFSNNGVAIMSFFTNKFKVADIVGRSVIIHQNPDDFRTEPAGNSGKKLACGVIRPGIPSCEEP